MDEDGRLRRFSIFIVIFVIFVTIVVGLSKRQLERLHIDVRALQLRQQSFLVTRPPAIFGESS
jgi:hypothetical protein